MLNLNRSKSDAPVTFTLPTSNEELLLLAGHVITVAVTPIDANQAVLGIEAAKSISILRPEAKKRTPPCLK